MKTFYSKFVDNLKLTEPGKWYKMAKQIGATDQTSGKDIFVEALEGMSNLEAADAIAEHFSAVSNEYSPLDIQQLPSYLPAPPPPQVDEFSVYKRMNKLKNTRSTYHIDIPNKLIKEFSPQLATPVADIFNECLIQQYYPKLWKYESITPVPKISHPETIKYLRKISSTGDYSKLFEGFLEDWILEDIMKNLDIGQYGELKGSGTEHMLHMLVYCLPFFACQWSSYLQFRHQFSQCRYKGGLE